MWRRMRGGWDCWGWGCRREEGVGWWRGERVGVECVVVWCRRCGEGRLGLRVWWREASCGSKKGWRSLVGEMAGLLRAVAEEAEGWKAPLGLCWASEKVSDGMSEMEEGSVSWVWSERRRGEPRLVV